MAARRKNRTRRTTARRPQATATRSGKAKMSTASKVAIASAAGVLAAGAAGLAATKRGRQFSRDVSRKITPVVKQQWHTIVNSVEASLIEAGLLAAIPANVRTMIMQRLGNGSATAPARRPKRVSTRRKTAKSANRAASPTK